MTQAQGSYQHALPDNGPMAAEWALDTLCGVHKPEAWVAIVTDPKAGAQWDGGRYHKLKAKLQSTPDAGHYVNQTLIKEFGSRTNDCTELGFFIFFDDVGEVGVNPLAKMDKDYLDMFGPTPTMIVETSVGNYQYFYVFNTLVPKALFGALIKAFKANPDTTGGFVDASGLVRYGRLPSGLNPKPGRSQFITRLVQGSGRKYEPLELARIFRLKMLAVVDGPTPSSGAAPDTCTIEELKALLLGQHAPLRNDARFDDRALYVELGHFVRGASAGSVEGLDVWNEWGAQRAQDPTDDPERVWDSIHSPRGGAGALRLMALKMDPQNAARVTFELGGSPVNEDLEVFDAGDEKGDIEPRAWLLGTTFCRGYLSGLISAGGSGKTTVRILQLLSCATGRALSGEHVFVRARVLVVCLEDDLKELRRRVLAARMRHLIPASEVKGWLYLTTPRRLKIAELEGKRVVAGGLYRSLSKIVDERKLDLVCIDPAIKAHGLDESSNPEIDAFATLLADLATEKNIGLDLLSHERKGLAGQGKVVGDADRGRGASALRDAQRLAKTLTVMNEKEALDMGVADVDRRFYVRVDDAKVNIAPPSAKTDWLKIVGVNLGNGNSTYPNGDNAQTAETWTPTVGVHGNAAQTTLWDAQSPIRRIRRGGQGARHPDTAATILGNMLGWSPQEAKKAVAKLIEDKLAKVVNGLDEKGHNVSFLEIVEPAREEINPF